jgi:enoyl-CoA hydratase
MPCEYSLNGTAAVLKLSNPPDHYFDETLVADIDRAVRRAEDDPAVKTIILTGAEPGQFIFHFNLRDVEKTSRSLAARSDRFGERRHVPERRIDLLFRRLETSSKITIAAISGTALGGATELAIACDFRLIQQGDFVMGVPEIRIGMLPGAGGTQRLTRLVGFGKALDLVLHGKRLSPDEALDVGLVHEVVEGSVLDRALERADDLAAIPAKALGHVKRLLYASLRTPIYEALDLERALFLELLASPEAAEMVGQLNARGGDFRNA